MLPLSRAWWRKSACAQPDLDRRGRAGGQKRRLQHEPLEPRMLLSTGPGVSLRDVLSPLETPSASDQLVVRFQSGTTSRQIADFCSQHKLAVVNQLGTPAGGEGELKLLKAAGGATEALIAALEQNKLVEYAEPDYVATAFMTPNDPYYSLQWDLDNPVNGGIQMQEAWDIETGDHSVVVAVLDTGVAYENYTQGSGRLRRSYYRAPDLANTFFVPGYDFVNNDTHPNDDNSHGTHVAGTIAQSTNNGTGCAGVAFNTAIMPVKVLNQYGSGTYSQIANGIYWATDHGADVINMSLGGASPSATLENAVKYAYEHGVTVIAASGNDGAGTVSYPAAYDEYVIAVGATRYDETLAYYSNYGASLDLVAPGGDLGVDQNNDHYGDGILQNTFNPNTRNTADFGYWFFDGTSMAAPHVSGVAALLIAAGVAATPADIRQALQSTAEDHGAAGWDPQYGWGIVDACAALQWSPQPDASPPAISNATGNTSGTTGEPATISATITDDVRVVSATVHYTPIGASETTVPMSQGSNDVWSTAVPVASNKVGSITYYITAADASGKTARDPTAGAYSIAVTDNDAPVAQAGPDQQVVVGTLVAFNGSGSSDNVGITSYSWDFDNKDGIQDDATGATAAHTYAAAGQYTATLTVADAAGNTASDTVVVTVSEQPPEKVEFEDSFEVSEWNSKWVEDSQNDWFRSRQRATNGSWSAEVDGAATDATLTMANAVNLSGKASATLTFSWFIESNWDAGEYIALDVSANGQGWTELKRLRGDVDQENVWHNETVNLGGAYLAAGFKIRFRAKVSDSAEDGNVDNVKIVSYALGSAAGGAAPLRGARSAQGGAAYVRPLNANAFAADLAAAKAGLFAFTAAQSGASSSGGVVSTSGLFNPFRLAPARSAGASVFDPVVSSVPSRPHAADAAIAALMSEGAQTFGEPHAPHDSSNGLDLPIPLRDRLPAKVVGG